MKYLKKNENPMKYLKKFENLSDKSELVDFIKKHITKVVALQSTFRDDGEDKFILYSTSNVDVDHVEYVTMLNKNGILIEPYYRYGDDKHYDQEGESYKVKYEDLDVEFLEKIKELILYGQHIDIL